jgi:hypothetical protein
VTGVVLSHHGGEVRDRDSSHPFLMSRPLPLGGREGIQQSDVLRSGGGEPLERGGQLQLPVSTPFRDQVAAEIFEHRTVLMEHLPEANSVAFRLEVGQVPRMLDQGEPAVGRTHAQTILGKRSQEGAQFVGERPQIAHGCLSVRLGDGKRAELLQNARRMISRSLAVLSLFVCLAASAQGVDPLRNVSGTAGNAGEASPWVRSGSGGWVFFHGFSAHVTHVSEVGPDEARSEVFSTNWLGAGLARDFGRGYFLVRGRASLEPYTIHEEGYPQTLQYVSAASGGPLVDSMRAHDLLGEAALQVGFRPTNASSLHIYAALVGDPALGAPPAELRASGIDFAEAPFSYDVTESFHDSTSVVTGGFATQFFTLEASVFHDAVTFGDHTEIDDGDIDSQSARITITPSQNFSLQASYGTLGEEELERKISSASVSFGTEGLAVTAMWTRRESVSAATQTAYGFEAALRGTRNTFSGRAEWVDRPAGFPESIDAAVLDQSTHFAVGYIFDALATAHYRGGVGVNIDYHTQSHELPERYGHKPQSVYAFVRLRSGA